MASHAQLIQYQIYGLTSLFSGALCDIIVQSAFYMVVLVPSDCSMFTIAQTTYSIGFSRNKVIYCCVHYIEHDRFINNK